MTLLIKGEDGPTRLFEWGVRPRGDERFEEGLLRVSDSRKVGGIVVG